MLIPPRFDKTLILMINSTSVLLASGMVYFAMAMLVDLPSATNVYWGIATLADFGLGFYIPKWP